jgi:hypothetical protein
MTGVKARLLSDELCRGAPVYGECQHSFRLCSFMELVFQLYRLGPCLDCGNEVIEGYMDQPAEALVKPIISIGVVNADLNDTLSVDGAVTVSLILYCSKAKFELTCDKEGRPRGRPAQNHDSPAWRRGYAGARYLQ